MAAQSVKILVCGDVEGQFKALFSRIESVNKKNGPFEFVLCVGNFFSSNCAEEWERVKNGSVRVPIPVYILGPNKTEHVQFYHDLNGCSLTKDIIHLGKRGILNSSSKVKIAYVSGVENAALPDNVRLSYDDVKTLELLLQSSREEPVIDVLLSSQWPKDVCKFAATPAKIGSDDSLLISRLCLKVKPRYHFAALNGVYYERLPYRNHKVLQELSNNVTRFISLARVNNCEKQKWLYAVNLVPAVQMSKADLVKQPPDVTETPFKAIQDRMDESKESTDAETKQYFFAEGNIDYRDRNNKSRRNWDKSRADKRHGDEKGRSDGEKRQRQNTPAPPKPTGPCWFCLASPEVEKHLVISVADQSYLALAKGCLTPENVLILPIGHYQSSITAPSAVTEEIEHFKDCLTKMFKTNGQGVVFYERNFRSQHLQVQVIPVPSEKLISAVNEFQEESESAGLELVEIPYFSNLKQILKPDEPYFYVELSNEKKFLHRIGRKFPLQFGRDVLASSAVLDIPDRADWRSCKYSKEDEAQMVKEFREKFKEFDFTL